MQIFTSKTTAKFQTFKGEPTIQFKFYKSNREINKMNLKNVTNSIKVFGQLHPILVTSDGYILDGQHRYLALKELGSEIWYTVNTEKGKEVIEEMNNIHKHWSNVDRVKNQAEDGLKDLELLVEQINIYKDKFKQNAITEAFSSKGHSITKLLKRKTYRYDHKQGTKVLKTCLALNEVTRGKSLQTSFVRAMCIVYRANTDYSMDVMVRNAKNNKIHVYNNTKDTAEEIIEIYNYRQKKHRLSL